jgi:translocation and assembly module TamA
MSRAIVPPASTHRFAAHWLLAVASVCLAPIIAHAGKLTVQVDGVDGELKTAVDAAAEIVQYSGRDVTAAQVRRLNDRAPEQIAKALQAYGYYHATATGELKETGAGFDALVHVKPGEAATVAALAIDVPDPARDERLVAKALREFAPARGARLDHGAYEKSKAAVQAALTASGYLDATLVTHRVEVSRADNRAEIALAWKPGPRYRYGATTFNGDWFAAGLLQRYIPWHEGDFYTQLQLLQLQQRLVDADYFGIIDVHPDLEHVHDGIVPITVNLAPAKRNVYTAGVFVDTDIGVGVRGGLVRRWFNDRGHKFKAEVEFAQRLTSVAGTYSIPLPGPNNRSYNFGAGYRDQNTDTTQSKTASLVANESRDWLGFTRTLGLHLQTGDFTILDPDGHHEFDLKGHSTLLYPELVLERKKADDPLFVHDGYALTLIGRASPGLLSDTHFEQARADAKWIHAFGERQRLIVRGSLGVTAVGDFDELTPELRFFAGGDRSIRGYSFQTIGPQNDNGLVLGGQDLVVASAEYEYYFKPNWGVATFVDAGDAFSGFANFKMRVGTGIGLRWRSPVGMVRVDLGVPVHDPYGASGVQLHLVIGPDL